MTLTSLGAFFGILAGAIQALAYLDYNQQVIRGKVQPNGSTWLVWALVAGLNSTTYMFLSGDWAKTVLPMTNAMLCIGTFILAFLGKRFDAADIWDILALGIGLSSALVWYHYQSATYANYVMQVSFAVGFIPTYRMVWSQPDKERIRPWLIWTVAYTMLTVAILLRWRGQWQDLVYPINCIILHPIVALLILIRSKKGRVN